MGLLSKKLLLILGLVLVLLGAGGFFLARMFVSRVQPVTLSMWGLWEEPAVMAEVIADYQRLHPNVKIVYKKQGAISYRERLANILQNPAEAPDIFRIHSSWAPMFAANIAPFPVEIFSPDEFQKTFYPVHGKDLVWNGRVMALPLEVDGLVLFVNTDLLRNANLSPATSWEELAEQAAKLTVRDPQGRIAIAGAALGTASNVDHWQEIVLLILLQNGANPAAPSDIPAAGAVKFYTDFVTKHRSWDETLEPSTQMFANGKLAYYFAPTWRYFDLKFLNDKLNFRVLPVFQLTTQRETLVASYWAEAVSARSPHQKDAFDFLKFLVAKENLVKLYSAEAKIRQFGEPYSRLDLRETLTNEPTIWAFLNRAEKAKSWYLSSFTSDGDTGINSRISKYYHDAVNTVAAGSDPVGPLKIASDGVAQVLASFGTSPAQEAQRLAN